MDLIDMSPPKLSSFLSSPSNASRLREERWYGMTHLHDACVKGDVSHVTLMIRHGADVCAVNAGGETPFHLAARRGIVAVAEEVRRSGGIVNVRDKCGRTALHFAAFGGNPQMVNYLLIFCKLDPTAVDKNGETFFHIACHNKKIELAGFCVRSKIFTATEISSMRNVDGSTAFDLSLRNFTADIPFLILHWTEMSLISDAYPEGTTRLSTIEDRAKVENSFRQLLDLVRFHRKFPRFSGGDRAPLAGPRLAYFYLLTSPMLLPPVMFFLFNLILPRRGTHAGSIVYAFCALIAWRHVNSLHRMHHVSKWPNPFLAGLFFAGIFYDLVIFYVFLLPNLRFSGYLISFCGAATVLCVFQYASLILGDPGRTKPCPSLRFDRMTVQRLTSDPIPFLDHCSNCAAPSRLHVRHCRLCDSCMDGFDHHCLFLLTCIADGNRRLFLLFLLHLTLVCIPIFLVSLTLCAARLRHAIDAAVDWPPERDPDDVQLLVDLPVVLWRSFSEPEAAAHVSIFVANVFVWIWIVYLIHSQLRFLGRGHTTSCVGSKCREDLTKRISWRKFIVNLAVVMRSGELATNDAFLI